MGTELSDRDKYALGRMKPPHSARQHDALFENSGYYGANFFQAVYLFFRRWMNLTVAKSSRGEFWWAQVFIVLSYAVPLTIVYGFLYKSDKPHLSPEMPLSGHIILLSLIPWTLFVLVANTTLTWRRLRDAGLGIRWWLLNLIPVLGTLILTCLLMLPSNNVRWEFLYADSPATRRRRKATGKTPKLFV